MAHSDQSAAVGRGHLQRAAMVPPGGDHTPIFTRDRVRVVMMLQGAGGRPSGSGGARRGEMQLADGGECVRHVVVDKGVQDAHPGLACESVDTDHRGEQLLAPAVEVRYVGPEHGSERPGLLDCDLCACALGGVPPSRCVHHDDAAGSGAAQERRLTGKTEGSRHHESVRIEA